MYNKEKHTLDQRKRRKDPLYRKRENFLKRERRKKNPEKYRQYYKNYVAQYIKKLRKKVLDKFGNKCVKCSFSDWRALQIDHVNGGGSKETRSINSANYYLKVLRDRLGKYQLLCANCNWIKRYEKKENMGDR